jgi:hypothetical protein
MAQRLQWRPESWRSGEGERLWLSMLVDAMEEVSRPDVRIMRCDPTVLARFRAQLALPASALPCAASTRRALGRTLPN